MSAETASKWLKENNKCEGVFVIKKVSFSDLKHTNQNILFCNAFKEKFSSMFHSNLVFADEKAFITADLLKLRISHDPFF